MHTLYPFRDDRGARSRAVRHLPPVFSPVPPDIDFVALEQAELVRWAAQRVFERSVEQREGAPPWIFYEGPPTANGKPGLHHVWARVYKDLFCRFRTMAGAYVARRAGWDTHGLPVEVEVEKKLGITSKQQIEDQVGIAEFTRLCRESVYAYVDEFERLTTRIGYWVDMDAAYWTLSPSYIESVWWHLQQLFDQGLLYEDLKVVPYCPRCGTALSSHELGQADVYRDEEDETAYVRLRLVDPDPSVVGDAEWLAVWTTTPWTLLSNTGVAVNPGLTYAVVDQTLMAEDLVDAVLGEGASARITTRLPGVALVGLRYERPFTDLEEPPGADGWRVVPADYVTTEEGTGLVHLAPAFGEIDRQIGRDNGLPSLNPVGPDGRFTADIGWLAGSEVRAADTDINDRLESAGLLIRRMPYVHSYPHCWRCRTPLIYWGKPSWYIATSTRKEDLLAANETVDWHPGYIKEGRFGEWLANNVDWALSRDRFWGTPLPIWRCGRGHPRCVGSLAELSDLAGHDVTGIDPHRPTIDEVTFICSTCVAEGNDDELAVARRVEPVIDAWFDSGSMPAAQVGYPYAPGSAEAFNFPADFISEAIDQTRGWFYSLLAINVIVFGESPYRHVVCLGHIVDADGRKMSKSLGNIIDPWLILDTRGADAMRWWMFSQGSPVDPDQSHARGDRHGHARHAAHAVEHLQLLHHLRVAERVRPRRPGGACTGRARRARSLDPLAPGRHHGRHDDGAERLRATGRGDSAGRLRRRSFQLVRAPEPPPLLAHRSRRAAWRHARGAGHLAHGVDDAVVAARTVLPLRGRHHVAPARRPRQSRTRSTWPTGRSADPARRDLDLEEQMALARRLTSLGRAARSEASVKVRQPLRRALVFLPSGSPRSSATSWRTSSTSTRSTRPTS